MIFGLFELGDRGRAKTLLKLADETINVMQQALGELPEGPDRELIEEHLSRRINARDRYAMLARGETDDLERLSPTMKRYEIWKTSMDNEIANFNSSAENFVWYLKQIKQ